MEGNEDGRQIQKGLADLHCLLCLPFYFLDFTLSPVVVANSPLCCSGEDARGLGELSLCLKLRGKSRRACECGFQCRRRVRSPGQWIARRSRAFSS